MKVTPRKYAQALADVLQTSTDTSKTIQNFFVMLRRRKDFKLLPKIVMAFEKEWCVRNGILQMNVTYPKKFENALTELESVLATTLGKTIRMKKTPSGTLIGGYKVQVNDVLVDASLETKLNSLISSFNH